ncbi:MAG: response regulator transcription factor, partial [Beijerinckiaceae bacterium]
MNAARPRVIPGDDAPHILIVDDDRRLRELLVRFLGDAGYRVTAAADALAALERLAHLEFDLVVADVMMPHMSGFDFVGKLRAAVNDVPVLMLTARADAQDRIRGLEIGADDYLTKPFEPRELILRISAILKRAAPTANTAAAEPPVELVRFGAFTFRLDRGELRRGEEAIHVTERERDILVILAKARGENVPRETLSGGNAANERTIDVQINRLRRKIEADPTYP